ncbi:ERF family protein [Bradyrhizobium sp. WSM 1738]|uniref:ERF family protein n=1 Tax=Bradyrhizobium hereditatis TaxID=2821405 RepID=UPI001CE38DC1|nr:ERF family protein [Bradyrhizobium hereditatis]MCA6114287.1 ERF family protein [Bradyrhizobium hereditatis]
MSAVVEMPEQPRRRATVPAVAANVDLVQAALKSGNVEMYREAVALFKELEGMAARKAFDNAMADAKAKIPVIRKNRRVGFDHKSGSDRTEYSHEDMAEIARTVDPILSEFGLSYRFKVSSDVNQPVRVTCILSHRDGHFEETALTAGRDDSGKKNAIQQVGSTITYLQRYTLKAALGLAAAQDDDGQSSESAEPETYAPPPGSITQDQVDFLRDALAEKGAAVTAFLQFAGAKGWFAGRKQRLEELPAKHYAAAAHAIATFKKA